ncbi:hypothetical protein ACFYU8_08805 [Brevibacillus sp. NPDC003359]
MQTGREVKYQAWIVPTGEMKTVTSLRFDINGELILSYWRYATDASRT